ncbi:Pol protein [Phytophthora palmivora]|uniref:Pol protein n=1 Tax=Phytophthora palmivora TaxID=4796 RepID=A0A2P4XLJ2_9STRA|nr:Pol protein [Phytophthora palmivora]
MVHLAPVRDKVTGKHVAQLFLDSTIVSDQDPRFTGTFWDTLFPLLGTKLTMSTADHPQTDGQTERVNRVLEDTLLSFCAEAPRSWSDQLPMVEFALNNAARKAFSYLVSDIEPESLNSQLSSFIDDRLTLIIRVRDAMALAQDKQMEYSDKNRGNLNTNNLPLKVVSSVESNKLKHRFIGPFAVLARHGAAYTIDLPKSMATHPTFYVGLFSGITIRWVFLLDGGRPR